MHKSYKKLVCSLCTFILLMNCLCIGVQAEDLEQSENLEVIEEKSYEVVSDIDELLKIASPVQKENKTRSSAVNVFETEEFTVKQLAKETVYSNGLITRDYVTDNIVLLNDTASYTQSESDSYGKYDIAMSITANARYYYYTSAPAYYIGITLNYLTTRFNDAGTNAITVSKIEMATHSIPGFFDEPIERFRTINNPSGGITYSLNSDDSRMITQIAGSRLDCGAIYTFSDGTSTGNYDLCIIYW